MYFYHWSCCIFKWYIFYNVIKKPSFSQIVSSHFFHFANAFNAQKPWRKSFRDMMALPALFKWEDCTPTQQIFPVLWYSCSKELYFWRVSCLSSFMLLALETSFRLVAKRRSGSAPCFSFFFCICFYVVLHRSMEHIPLHLSSFQNSLYFIICRWKNNNLTNRGGSFYLNLHPLSGFHVM